MKENVHTISDLYQMQALPLKIKISMTKRRIRDWVNEYGVNGVYISFSGGKDSTVLLHIAREMYPEIKAVFSDTGLEYPEIRQFVKTFDNVDIVRPKMGFKQVCEQYGFPLISKEVSESVFGARKYLTNIIEEYSHLNERTNETKLRLGNGRYSWNRQKEKQKQSGIPNAKRGNIQLEFIDRGIFFNTYEKSKGGGYEDRYNILR